jgi:PAS domain S-box-containing protein
MDNENNSLSVIDGIPGLVAIMTPEGVIETINPQIGEYCGGSLETLQNWGTNGTVHAEDVPFIAPIFADSMASGEPYNFECRIRRFDGVYRLFQVRGLPFRERGRIARWYVLLTDIHERKLAEEALRVSEAELRRAYNSFRDAERLSKTGSFVTDIVADDHHWSEEAYRIFEFDPTTKVTVQGIRELVHPDDLEGFDGVIEGGVRGAEVDFLFRITTASGTLKHIRGLAHVIETVAGRPMFVGALQDVTENKVAEEALEKARSELTRVASALTLSTLAASIAHEVNQPLAGITTNASVSLRMLASEPPNVEGASAAAQRTLRDAKRATEVIRRLKLMFARKDAVIEPVDLNEAAREVIALCLSDLTRNGVTLKTELAVQLPQIVGDRVQLQQVILNLILNASDAMIGINDRIRAVLVRTEQVDENVHLTVEDTGVGFDAEAAKRLFEAFYTTKAHGMGIGLSISRSIIAGHQGRLWAIPKHNGPGAAFCFSIPTRASGIR